MSAQGVRHSSESGFLTVADRFAVDPVSRRQPIIISSTATSARIGCDRAGTDVGRIVTEAAFEELQQLLSTATIL